MPVAEQDPNYLRYMDDIRDIPLISPEREIELSEIIQSEEASEEEKDLATEELIRSNLRLVVKCALDAFGKCSQYRHISIMDLIAEGNISLMKTAKRFIGGTGAKFATYAFPAIKRDIQKFISLSVFIHIPLHHFKYWNLMKEVEAKHEGSVDDETMAKELGISVNLVEWVRTGQKSSMTKMIDAEEEWHDRFITDPGDTDETIENSDLKRFLISKMEEGLTKREKSILCDKFFNYPGCTLEFLGQKYGVTRERIRQICARAFKRMRLRLKDEWYDKFKECEHREREERKKERATLKGKTRPYGRYMEYAAFESTMGEREKSWKSFEDYRRAQNDEILRDFLSKK